MKLYRNNKKHIELLAILTTFILLIGLSACDIGSAPSAVSGDGEETANLSIVIPNLAPWVQEKADQGDFEPNAWLINDAIEFQLYDPAVNLVTWFVEEPGVESYYDWVVPTGEYFLYTWIYNYNSADWINNEDASVFGAYPPQADPWNPITTFTINSGDNLSVVVTNYPAVPILIVNSVLTADYTEITGGEKWFTINTGPTDSWLYVDSYSTSADEVTDADMDLYLFGPDGLYITSSAAFSDGDPGTADSEIIESSAPETTFTVVPDATYYVAIHAYVGGVFSLYFESTP